MPFAAERAVPGAQAHARGRLLDARARRRDGGSGSCHRSGGGRREAQPGLRAHLGQQRLLPGGEGQGGEVLQDGADAYALVGHPVDGVVAVTGLPDLSVTA